MPRMPDDSDDMTFAELLESIEALFPKPGTRKRPRSRVERREAAWFYDADRVLDGVARAIYMTHQRPPAPVWENASPAAQAFIREQARSALRSLRALARRATP
jgi:hypothetical protein